MTNTMKRTRRARDGSGRSKPKQGGGGTKREAKDAEVGRKTGRKPAGRGRVAGGKARHARGRSTEENWAKRAGATLLPRSNREACGAIVVVAERVGGDADIAGRACRIDLASGGNGLRRRGCAKGRGGDKRGNDGVSDARRAVRLSAQTCRVLAAVGHEQRGRLLTKLVEGPATYRTLQRATKLKPGPLYHHINQLRLAGLILPKQRDLYELTRGGRNLILAVMAMAPLIRDSRRRPLATE